MGFIKKVLYGFLITSLLLACTVVAAIIFSKSSDSDGSIAGPEGSEEISISIPEGPRPPRNAMTKPKGSDIWLYYPDLPENAKPGDIVTINAPAYGFLGWETDSMFAEVDLSNQIIDEEKAYVTFVVPEEDIAVMAIFDSINFYDDRMTLGYSRFDGAFDSIIAASLTVPTIPTMPIGVVGDEYEHPVIIPSIWSFVDDPAAIPAGWNFDFDTGIISNDDPQVATTITINLKIEAMDTDPDTGDPVRVEMPFPISITIIRRPTFPQTEIPDGMIGVEYSFQFLITDPYPGVLEWGIDEIEGSLPINLVLNKETGILSGIPAQTVIPGEYNFTVVLTTLDATINSTVSNEFTIYIWAHPEILDKEFLDGMRGQPYVFHAVNDITLARAPAFNDPKWEWVGDNMPPGLSIAQIDANTARLISSTPGPITQGIPSAAYDDEFTITLRPVIPNPNVATISKTFYIKIWERPEFLTDMNGLADGMDSLRRYEDDEPEEDEDYMAMIEVWYPEDMPFEWEWDVDGALPPGLELLEEIGDFTDKRLIRGLPLDQAAVPGPLSSKQYSFNIEIEAVSTNININGAVVSQPYNLMIWARRYLYIDISQTTAHVIRDGEDDKAGWKDPLKPNWDLSDEAKLYQSRRAVRPGTQGVIRSLLGVSGFIRWEVRGPNDQADISKHDPLNPSIYPNSNSRVQIGGPDYYWNEGIHGYVLIEMPSFTTTERPITILPANLADGDVYIRGVHTRMPVINSNWSPGVVDDPFGGVITIGGVDVGEGTGLLRWNVLRGDAINIQGTNNSPVPGLQLNAVGGEMTGIIGIPTRASQNDEFNFTVGINLPGTMRLERDFHITIDPIPSVRLGDINGDGLVNLEDLILLARYVAGERDFARFDEDAADLNGNGGVDGGDLRILSAFFAVPTATLPRPPPAADLT